MIFWNL